MSCHPPRTPSGTSRRLALLLAALVAAGCASPGHSGKASGETAAAPAAPTAAPGAAASCPAKGPAPDPLPRVRAEHQQLGYWLARVASAADPDDVVLSEQDIADHNEAFAVERDGELLGHYDLLEAPDPARLRREVDERLTYLRERVAAGSYVGQDGKPLAPAQQQPFAAIAALPPLASELRVALEPVALRCGPRLAGLYQRPDVNPAFDRNACSTIRPQEPVQVLARAAGGMTLVRSRYALGWIAPDAPLSALVPAAWASAFVLGPRLRAAQRIELRGRAHGLTASIEPNLLLAASPAAADAAGRRAVFATPGGFDESQPLTAEQAAYGRRPLTRRALLQEAFRYLGTSYGWGDQGGGRDCSRLVMDVFESFGLHLPRHSGLQARAASMSIDLDGLADEQERLALIDAAARRGIVLLHFPGHIMLYLGRSAEGQPMVLHAFAEYLEPCSSTAADGGAGETKRQLGRVTVSDLELGRGTSRRSFVERLTRIAVFGRTPGPELLGAAQRRPAAAVRPPEKDRCPQEPGVAVHVSPARPHPAALLRVVVTSARDLGSVEIGLLGPDGRRVVPALRRLGGPPFGYLAQIEGPAAGQWTALVGDGARLEACARWRVYDTPAQRQAGDGPVWQPRRRWSEAIEGLYAAFVEQLFDYPLDDRTWSSLRQLLRDRDHNILFGHLGQGEDERLSLQPDCADLPYFLRAYFAWKLRLPFGFRKCNRGEDGRAPFCDRELGSDLAVREERGEVEAFQRFVRATVADAVHSGNGRTGPRDDLTDYYPIALGREAIRPGAVFADPYGHVLVVADWLPQAAGSYGVLVGADAQPDGTIGRRRFWPGSFLFTPDTTSAGAGFKAFRPLVYRGGEVRAVPNAQIAARPGAPAYSEEQYGGSADDFYARVEALINPRPLDARAVLLSRVDALAAEAQRRVQSVAERHLAEHPGIIEMPRGHAIFETTGPWEDFATPSRDMRLLIAIDTVQRFPAAVAAHPERYRLPPGPGPGEIAAGLRRDLEAELRARRFTYARTDATPVSLTLAELVARGPALEMAYNPNDCVEIRWGAPEGSAERSTCRRRAPDGQRQLMEEYRRWFAARRRPPR
ncbi:MAG: C40 family peptidase [Deltaproteobacteria bacterium]|nr:C40 family peptidase [Deltaproteobacteria bacterium]